MQKMKHLTIAKLMVAAMAYRPPPPLTGSEWSDRYRVLPSADAEPGSYRTDRFPLVREIQDTLSDEDTRETVLWGPTQTAKTTIICNFVGQVIHFDPGRTLIVYPTEDKAIEFSTEKLEPMLIACPALAEKAAIGTARTHRKSVLDKTLPGMVLRIRGGNSENPFSAGSMKNVILDELDRIPRNKEGRPVDLARQRCGTFTTNYKLVMASTCTDQGNSEIESEYLKSDQRKPYVPCLSCGHMHIMGFFPEGTQGYEPGTGYIDFDDAQEPEAAKAAARYRCPVCRHEHYDRDKPAMLARLVWRKHNPSSKTAGFWWSALYSPWVSFGQLGYEFRSSKEDDDAYRVFWNCRLSRTWKVKTDAPSASILDACVDPRPRGDVPSESLVLTGGADVQKHVVYWVVRAWGANGRSWLINHGVTERDDGALGWLDEVFATPYGGHAVRMALIDSGWDEEAVYDYCLARRNCVPSKGVPTNADYDVKDSEQTREKGQYRGHRFTLWLVNSNRLRAHIHDRIPLPADSPRAWRLHSEVDSEYRKHILARERQLKKMQSRMIVEWTNPDKPDHYMDAEILALGASKTKFIAPLLVAGPPPREYISLSGLQRARRAKG